MAGASFPHYYLRSWRPSLEKEAARELSGHDPNTTIALQGLPQGKGFLYHTKLQEIFRRCYGRNSIKLPKVYTAETRYTYILELIIYISVICVIDPDCSCNALNFTKAHGSNFREIIILRWSTRKNTLLRCFLLRLAECQFRFSSPSA